MARKKTDPSRVEALLDAAEQMGQLWTRFMAVRETSPDEAALIRRQIGLEQGRIAARSAADEDPHDYWCVWCERVSAQPDPLDGFPRCRYPDCDPLRRYQQLRQETFGPAAKGHGYSYTPGRSWFEIRQALHPEYPEVPEEGRRYPVPEIPPNLIRVPEATVGRSDDDAA